MYATLVFGLNGKQPVDYGKMKRTHYVEGQSGDANWDYTFDMATPRIQLQLREFCDIVSDADRLAELGFSASDLKIAKTGPGAINPQLAGVTTGSIADTASPSDTSKATPLGTQCFFHAFEQFENVTKYDKAANEWRAPAIPGAQKPFSWDGAEPHVGCRWCWQNFSTDPAPAAGGFANADLYHMRIFNTSRINDGCNCVGMFPVPQVVCLDELQYLGGDTKFACVGQDNMAHDLSAFGKQSSDDFSWWAHYIYALADESRNFERFGMLTVTVETVLPRTETNHVRGLAMSAKWAQFVDKYNKAHGSSSARRGLDVMVHISAAPSWTVTEMMLPSAVNGTLLSMGLAYVILVFAASNWFAAAMAILNIGMIVTVIFGFIKMSGWGLGPIESILCVLVVGFSVDYTVHLTDSYMGSKRANRAPDGGAGAINDERYLKVRDALSITGVSVVSGAISTLGASLPMLGAVITFFSKFGIFMLLTIFLSLVFSLGNYCAMLMIFGPLGDFGQLYAIYGPYLEQSYKEMKEERAERAQETAVELTDNAKTNPIVTAEQQRVA